MLIPVLLSGGAGTRLWPVSRAHHPKPFMKLKDGESLLLKTYQRAAATIIDNTKNNIILTVTNRDYYFISKDEFAEAKVGHHLSNIFLLEPSGRNTAPAILMAAHYIMEKFGPDAVMLILPTDHLIEDEIQFIESVRNATQLAHENRLVTFGIFPTTPQTGYGYIEGGEKYGTGQVVRRFIEKPSLPNAQHYISEGNFYWNSGMFCFKASVILEEMKRYAPEVANSAKSCWNALKDIAHSNTDMFEIPTLLFNEIKDISIDYAVMEHSNNVMVIPSNFGWNDIGSWSAVRDLITPDVDDNRVVGEAIFVDSKNTFVQSENRLVATVGTENLIIIDTNDALLIVHPDNVQDVKKVVSQLKKRDHDTYKNHRTVFRPWGAYTVLEEGPCFKIKRIEVKSGGKLSLQMHYHRSEHWIVVSGVAKIVNGDKELFVHTNESTYIPAGQKHRLENPSVLPLIMIEVQSGEYLGEDDIIRFEDSYGRIK